MRGLGSRLWQGLASEAGCVSGGPAPTAMQRRGLGLPPLGWRPFSSKPVSPTEKSASKSKEQAAYLVRLGRSCCGLGLAAGQGRWALGRWVQRL